MQINWWTLALQAINFLVLVWLLQRFLYRPVRAVIDKRKELAERAFAEAEAKKQEAEAAKRQCEDSRAQLAGERQEMQKKVHEELEGERDRIVDAARKEAEQLLAAARETIVRERQTALSDLREQTADLAIDLASGLLRKTGATASSDAFLEQIATRLDALPPDELDGLRQDIAGDGARLTVRTATPLPPDDRERWRNRLGKLLDCAERTDFSVDPDILGGAELRFPHSVLRFTWADQLSEARKLMSSGNGAS